MNKNKYFFLSFIILFSLLIVNHSVLARNLNGKILLQVEDKGQAWYLNPVNQERYFLGRPEQAFLIMRNLGLGVSNKDLNNFLNYTAPTRLAGRILLQVEDKGQAYYVEPDSRKLYYLGRPHDAFHLMSQLGLGISNVDLEKISINIEFLNEQEQAVLNNDFIKKFAFKYQNKYLVLDLKLSHDIFKSYNTTPKVLEYKASNPPANLQEAFYKILLDTKKSDSSITEISNTIKELARENKLNSDQLAELALALVQYIPYDNDKILNPKIGPYFPYETLYFNKGVCSDTTFLAYNILENLGYGVAIMDFPDINHTALGIACPLEDSIKKSGYCYAETTNYFPIGVIPNNINGQASSNDYGFDTLFTEKKLGKIEIFNKKEGSLYYGAMATQEKVKDLSQLYGEILDLRNHLNNNRDIVIYNEKVNKFNIGLKDLYQK